MQLRTAAKTLGTGLVLSLVALIALVYTAGRPAHVKAAAGDLTTQQSCLGSGGVRVRFGWQNSGTAAAQQWLDVSLSDNGWAPGTFIGAGPLNSASTSFTWDGLIGSRVHYVRVNQRQADGSWMASSSVAFTTSACPSAADIARAQLAGLAVMAAGPMTGYSRGQYGPAWEDVDDNNCDTRNDILKRDLTAIMFRAGSTCIVQSGTLDDPYTGKTIAFVRGPGTSSAVQIDHIVALGDTWRTGAASWTANKRLEYANDPLVLLAVDGPANASKSDKDAASWVPRIEYQCAYVERQIAIKKKYLLWVTPEEHDALQDILADCDDNADAQPPSGDAPSEHTWYTSASATASVYYCELDKGWTNISAANLRGYASLDALLAAFPSRVKSATSKC